MAARDLLTENEIKQITKTRLKTNNFKLKQYNFKTINTEGLMGTHLILTTTIETSSCSTDITYFVKTLPVIKTESDLNDSLVVFEKEIFFYNLFNKNIDAEFIKKAIPTCYFTKDNTTLVLQNLISDGYRILDKNVRDLEIMLLAVKSFATFHAASIVYEEKLSAKLNRPYKLLDDHRKELEEVFYGESYIAEVIIAIKCVKKTFGMFEIALPEDIEKLFDNIPKLIRPSSKIRNTICHGDTWFPNIMINSNNCKLIDFQFIRYCPPTSDLLVFTHLVTKRDFRKKYLNILFDEYYKQFSAILISEGLDAKEIFPRDVFLESCEEYKLLGVLEAATTFQIDMMHDTDRKKLMENYEVRQKVFLEDRSVAYDYVEIDREEYFERIKESILDVKEMCDIYL